MYIEGVDSIDNRIIHLLKDHARRSYSAIGEQVGLSRVAVKNRIDALERKGIIQGYKTIINPEKSTEGVQFVIDIEVQTEHLQTVVEALCKDRYIRQVYSTIENGRLHCQGYAPSRKSLEIHVRNLFKDNVGILKMEWHIMMTTYKNEDGGVEYEGVKEGI